MVDGTAAVAMVGLMGAAVLEAATVVGLTAVVRAVEVMEAVARVARAAEATVTARMVAAMVVERAVPRAVIWEEERPAVDCTVAPPVAGRAVAKVAATKEAVEVTWVHQQVRQVDRAVVGGVEVVTVVEAMDEEQTAAESEVVGCWVTEAAPMVEEGQVVDSREGALMEVVRKVAESLAEVVVLAEKMAVSLEVTVATPAVVLPVVVPGQVAVGAVAGRWVEERVAAVIVFTSFVDHQVTPGMGRSLGAAR